MKLLNTWSDDHLPCFGFEHNGTYYEVLWTAPALIGRLEMVEEGSATIEAALSKYPQLLQLVNAPDPRNVAGLERDDEEDENGAVVYQLDIGCVNVHTKQSYDLEHTKYNY